MNLKKIAAMLAAAPALALAQGAPPPQYAPPPQAPPPQYAPPPQQPPPPALRPPKTRDRWYIGFGIGSGDGSASGQGASLSFKEMNLDRSPANVFLNFKVGATLTPKLLLGFDLTAISSTADGSGVSTAVSVVNADIVATYFPVERGFFLRGGLGRAALNYSIDDGFGKSEWSPAGFNLLGGLGYAFWIGRSFNLTLNLDFTKQWYGSSNVNPESSSFWAGWIGFDWY